MQRTLIRSLVLGLACAAVPGMAPAQEQPRQSEQSQPVAQAAPEASDNAAAPSQRRSRFRDEQRDEDRAESRGEDRGESREGRGEGQGFGDNMSGPAQFYRPPAPFEPPTVEEWEKALAFMKEHAPKRWALHLNLPEPAQQPIREFMFVRYRQLERVRNADRDMYDIHLRRFALEDEIYALLAPLFSPSEPRSLTPEELSKLREKVTAQVDLHLEERESRLQRLRELLLREERQLAADKAQRENIISQRMGFLEIGRGVGRLSGGFSTRGGGGMGGPRPDGGGPGDRPGPSPR